MKNQVTFQKIENCRAIKEFTYSFNCFNDAVDAMKIYIHHTLINSGKKAIFNQPNHCWDIPDCCGDGIRILLDTDLKGIYKADKLIQEYLNR